MDKRVECLEEHFHGDGGWVGNGYGRPYTVVAEYGPRRSLCTKLF